MAITISSVPMYSIRDRGADEYGPPFCAKNDTVAKRAYFAMCVQNRHYDISEYELVQVGFFDKESGLVSEAAVKIVPTSDVDKKLKTIAEREKVEVVEEKNA